MATSMLAIKPRPANPASRSSSRWQSATAPPSGGSTRRLHPKPSGRGIVARCRSSAATAAGATNRLRRNSCNWSASATRKPSPSRRCARARHRQSDSLANRAFSIRSLNELAALLNRAVSGTPRHDRYRRGRILRRAFDELVGIHHIDQYIPFGVAAADDLHLLEEQRAPLPKHVLALLRLGLEADRADLAAGQRDIRDFFRESQPALEAALLRYREMAGHA